MSLRVLVNGARGKMGQVVCEAVRGAADLELVAACDLGDDLRGELQRSRAEVAVDFTVPQAAAANCRTILEAGVRPVVGTTGFSSKDLQQLTELAVRRRLGGIIAPNFALGVILLQRFATVAARHFPDVEILELHHEQKLDAPSGTAVHTARLLAAARGKAPQRPAEKLTEPGCRGASVDGVPVHSIRLPGLLAHQEVLFGGAGQVLSLRHDTTDRRAFVPGVLLAIRSVPTLGGLVVGLEHLLP